jgi:AcrR family transcriptional regulator
VAQEKKADLPPKKPAGRPRVSRQKAELPPREEILAAASALFSEQGVGAVTFAQIAERSGLRQASLYYWFPNKEHILATIVRQANRVSLDYVQLLEKADDQDPAVQLWRLVYYDVRVLCSFPFDINEVHRLTPRCPEAFDVYWAERFELISATERFIREGIAQGRFREVDPQLAALTVLGSNEATQNWYRPVGGYQMSGRADTVEKLPSVDVICGHLADTALASLLRAPGALGRIRKKALALDAALESID